MHQPTLQERSFRTFVAAVAIIVLVVVLGAVGFYVLENHYRAQTGEHDLLTWVEAFYFIIETITTTGYGDITPMFQVTKLYTTLFMIFSFLILAMVGAIAVAYIIEGHLRETVRRRQMKRTLESMRDHYIICGLGRVGMEVVNQFRESGQEYVLIDASQETIDRVVQDDEIYLTGDASEDAVLLEAGIERARCLIACIPNDASNVFTVLTARGLNAHLMIIARGLNENAHRKLMRAGASRVVLPSHIGGMRMATMALRPAVVDFLDQTMLMTTDSEPLLLEEIPIGEGSDLDGVMLKDSQIRSRTGVTVLGVRNVLGHFSLNPSSDLTLTAGCILIGLGYDHQFHALREWLGVPEPPDATG